MSTKYKHKSEVPTEVLVKRLKELAAAAQKGDEGWGEFTMRIPAELDRDADCVLHEAANRLQRLSSVIKRLAAHPGAS